MELNRAPSQSAGPVEVWIGDAALVYLSVSEAPAAGFVVVLEEWAEIDQMRGGRN